MACMLIDLVSLSWCAGRVISIFLQFIVSPIFAKHQQRRNQGKLENILFSATFSLSVEVFRYFVPYTAAMSPVLTFYLSSNAANAGSNKAASSSTSLNTRKLDEDTENLSHEKVPTELKKAIMQARQDKKLTQAQLAQLINEKPQIIQEYESGKAIPNQQIISKLERALGAKLRGKK
ncbi:multiprotein-bridging factor 1a-like [Lycium barbarum]|uniref:multiprotein-bridging factor 1a-like n=1 Tax=Lycium barbarum TaxID=112863 RepID=UPI00293E10F3|nr:multiprotein-bridging factor 1a-like [Lycium barbarum]